MHFLSRQLDAVVLSPLPYHQCGHDERQRCPVEQPTSRRASPSSPLGTRASGKIFTARRCFKPRKWHFRTCPPPATARRCTLSPCSSPWRFSLPPALTAWEWKGGIQSISPTSRCGPPRCAPPACGPPSCACPSYVALSCSASLAEVVGSHPSFPWPRSHTTPSCAAPPSGSRGGISSSVLSPSSSRLVGITSCAPTLGAWGACLAEALPICRGSNGGE